ncbi:MAG: DNA repair protein RadC [Betaproteobacteria bacterium]|nr:DNA repair protein RadC [Betaproteobacteria bacterium]
MAIKDWPAHERPREKLLLSGAGTLTDAELLAVLLGTGVRGRDALSLARDLLGRFGSISNLIGAHTGHAAANGLGPARQALLRASAELVRRALAERLREREVLGSPQAVKDYLRLTMLGRERECFVVLFLDAQNRVIASEELFSGTLTQTPVFPREIVRRCLVHNAAALIFAHNHPSGVAEPSRADEQLTRSLKATLANLDIRVLDHIIVGAEAATSLAERGLL